MRVVIAEDHVLLRDGLIRLLEANGFDVVEAVDSGPLLRDALARHRPDVAVVDVRLPPMFTDEGIVAAIAARREMPGLPVLVLSQYVEQLYARELLADQAGGVGYLAVAWFLRYIAQHRFTGFVIYRVLLGATLLVLVGAGTLPAHR